MKNLLITMLLCTGVLQSASAQKLDASKIPAPVKETFAKKFPGVTPGWENEKGKYEASFKSNGQSMSALFNANGSMLETEVGMKVSALPTSVTAYVKEHYKGATIREAAKITKADGTINYEAEVNKMDVIFDADGKFLKEEQD